MRKLGCAALTLALVGWASGAAAQAELTGTYIRYLRVGANGALVDIPGMRSMQYSSAGTAAGAACDLYYPGSPAVGFTLRATPAGGVAAQASNNSGTAGVTTLSAPAVSGRAIDWAGRWTAGAVDVRVDQRVEYATGDHFARMTVTLTNQGTVALGDVYYFLSGDPDHGQCNIGTEYETNNDVVRQFPAQSTALATATAGTPAITFGLGSPDPRARANNGGFENTDAVSAWGTPIDSGGALVDEDIGIVFREPSLAAGRSTTFVVYLVWGTSVAEVGTRLDAAIAADRELTGTYIRYLRLGDDGAMVDRGMTRSMQYSEAGGTTDASCDLYGPGAPAAGFTVTATAGATTASASNVSSTTGITRRAGPFRAGRTLRWTGNWTSGAINLDVEQEFAYATGDRAATVTVRLTNRGATALTNVHYFFSGDPDHGQCNIGTEYETNNDVYLQRPGDPWAVATASAGSSRTYVYAIGSDDVRARANNGGFENTDAVTAFTAPVDSGGALLDEDIGLVFREPSLAAGASTTFVMRLAWGTSQAQAYMRMTGSSVGAPNGTACSSGATCLSGFCVDGVCCNSACGGGVTTDCQACSTSAGAAVSGTCGAASAATVCRAAAGACDAAETCNGTSLTCPADALAAAGTACRPASGGCDVAEVCDGLAATCPSDGLAAAGVVCRAAAGACDLPESCDGASGACPADAFAAAGTTCRPATSACDAAEACDGAGAACPADLSAADGTPCGDGAACNGDEVCALGTCMPGTMLDCDDGDVCTADACAEPGTCSNTPIDDCCVVDADCDDLDPCTTDTCSANVCASTPIAGCGGGDAGAGDGGAEADAGVGAEDGSVSDSDGGPMRGGSSGGCSCRAAGTGTSGSPLGATLALAALAIAVLARRRRR